MASILENAHLQLRFSPGSNVFSVEPKQKTAPRIRDAHFSVRYRRGGFRFGLDEDAPASIGGIHLDSEDFGEIRRLDIRLGPNRHGLTATLSFAVPPDAPMLFWRATIENTGRIPVFLEKIEMLRVGFASADKASPGRIRNLYPRGDFEFQQPAAVPAFYSNGWGSWNHTGVLGLTDTMKKTRLGPFTTPMRVNPGTPQPASHGHFASDMFAVLGDRVHRGGLLVGFLSQLEHFGSLEALIVPGTPALSLWANGDDTRVEPGGTARTDWACLQPVHLDAPDPLKPYLETAARIHGIEPDRDWRIPVGWCSWYRHFQDISAELIEHSLAGAQRLGPNLPLDIIQIDDGWQAEIGDWDRFDPGFPDGPAPLAAKIRNAGLTPGIWLAPFIVHPDAEINRTRPEWLLRNRAGLPVTAGYVWNRWTRVLDISRPEVMDHAVESVRRAAADWGFSYLKLDFLYAAARSGQRHDPTRSRAAVLRDALERFRGAVGPEAVLVGCGSPLGSGIGVFDAMRIGADVAPHWRPRQYNTERFFRREPDMPSARNAVQNVITRAPLHRRWWVNDPDCLILRSETDLTIQEVHSLATVVAMSGGSILLSDDLATLSADRLQIARALLPPIGSRPHVLDWFERSMPARLQLDLKGPIGSWHLIAVFNWDEIEREVLVDPADFYLDPEGRYIGREFWTGEIRHIAPGNSSAWILPPHGCAALAIRDVRRKGVQYLGSSLHFSQGLEAAWGLSPGRADLELKGCGAVAGVVDLLLPGEPNGPGWEALGEGVFRFPVRFEKRMELEISY